MVYEFFSYSAIKSSTLTAKLLSPKINETNKSKNALSVNLIAIEEIIRQISFRDISGIIIVDFINMKTKEKEILEENIKKLEITDNKIWNFHGFTKLGLYEITRQRGK